MGKTKLNIPMCAAAVLLFLTLLSIHLTSGLFARYTSHASASDSARVAKFDVGVAVDNSITANGVKVDCVQSNTGTYTFTVSNNSEVAVRYSLHITLNHGLMNATDLYLLKDDDKDDKDKDQPKKYYPGTNNVYKFTNLGQLGPAGDAPTTREHKITFGVDRWRTVTKDAENTATYDWNLDFTVDVIVEQID